MKYLFLLMSLVFVAGCAETVDDHSFSTLVKGSIANQDGKHVLLLPDLQDPRTYAKEQTAQIINGKFEHRVAGDHIVRYSVLLLEEMQQGSWSSINFFPDAEEVNLNITSWPGENRESKLEFKIKGGSLNREMTRFNDRMKTRQERQTAPLYKILDSLDRTDKYMSDPAREIYAQLNAAGDDMEKRAPLYSTLNKMRETKEDLSPEARAVVLQLEEYERQYRQEMYNYMNDHLNLFAYSLLGNEMFFYGEKADPNIITPLADKYAQRYPNHPYTVFMTNMVRGMAIRPGRKFIDFTAPDPDGNMHTLSEEIKGRIACIDLWASWCGPCRANSKSIIPVYNQYKDKGFTVVAIARERKNTDALRVAIEKDGYPWLNLVELDDANGIWSLYNAPNAAGKTILVDEQGIIVAVNPSAEEVSEYLASHLPHGE